jgi:hypothetical protein
MSQPISQRLTVGSDTFIVKVHGPYSQQGETLWLATTVIAMPRTKDDRTIAGDAFIGSPEYQVGGLSGSGGTPDAAYHDLEEKLTEVKAHES